MKLGAWEILVDVKYSEEVQALGDVLRNQVYRNVFYLFIEEEINDDKADNKTDELDVDFDKDRIYERLPEDFDGQIILEE